MELSNIDSLPTELQNTATSYSYAAGQRLFRQGDSANNFYLIIGGRIKLVRYTIEGRMVVLQTVKSGASIGEDALIPSGYSYTAIAETESRAISYPQPLLTETLRNYPELAEDLTSKLIAKIHSLSMGLELLQVRSAHLRLLQYLQYNTISSDRFVLDRTWKEVAAELDLAPRTLSRALTRLASEGRITRQGGSIALLGYGDR